MRQAGLKPKSHSSGVYWTRAASKGRGGKKKKQTTAEEMQNDTSIWDFNGDGKIDYWDVIELTVVTAGVILCFGFLIYLEFS
jgi:hypothetical protein